MPPIPLIAYNDNSLTVQFQDSSKLILLTGVPADREWETGGPDSADYLIVMLDDVSKLEMIPREFRNCRMIAIIDESRQKSMRWPETDQCAEVGYLVCESERLRLPVETAER
jgi:hypothetical protein